MFSRIFRTTIQSSIVRGSLCKSPVLTAPIARKLQDVHLPNYVNKWSSTSRSFNSASSIVPLYIPNISSSTTLFSPPTATSILDTQKLNIGANVPVRSLVKFSRSRGKRRMVRAVVHRFFRLNWGIWIRTKAGRHKRMWRQRSNRRRRLRQHVFCNATQSWLLDKMVSPYFRKPKYWVDDPYNPYQTREEFWVTRRQPIEYE